MGYDKNKNGVENFMYSLMSSRKERKKNSIMPNELYSASLRNKGNISKNE